MGYNEYYEEELKKRMKVVDDETAKRKTEDEALKQQINTTLDTAAGAAAGVYRQDIEQAPLDSRVLYDQNAMREAIDRKKISESLANMGMTDSGMTSSMQTALTVQKSRADSSVRAAEQQRIRAAESAIDQIYANVKMEKASQGLAIDQATAQWEREQRLNAEQTAAQNATSRHNAEVEAITKAATEAAKMQQNDKENRIKYAQGIQDNRSKLAQQYINGGMSPDEAWAKAYTVYPDAMAWGEAYALYPDDTTDEGVKYAYYNQMIKEGLNPEQAMTMANAYVNAGGADAASEDARNQGHAAAATELWTMIGKEIDEAESKYAEAESLDETFNTEFGQGVIAADKNQLEYLLSILTNRRNQAEGNKFFGTDAVLGELDKRIAFVKAVQAGKVNANGVVGYVTTTIGTTYTAELGNMGSIVADFEKQYAAMNLSDVAKACAVAQKTGEMYLKMVQDSNDGTVTPTAVGGELEKYFSGIYLDIALDAAGLQ